jgi:hypothetical protein
MKVAARLFTVGYGAVSVFFWIAAVALVVFATMELWHGIDPSASLNLRERFESILEAVGMLTISVAAFELGQTVLEEEVQRDAELSAPTRVRRFLSRFLIVVVVALSVETLIAVFELAHSDPSKLPQAASIGVAAAAILAAWGVFVRLNTTAEELEPEAMAAAKREDDD